MQRPDRHGNLLWVALGTLFLASIGAFTLVNVTRTGTRQVGLAKHETEARWAAHAALTSFANRLKMRPWPGRFYSGSATEYATSMTYRGRPVSLWARDSVRGTRLETGTTDVFAKVVEGDLTLGVFQRLRIMPAAATNPRAMRVIRELTVREDFETPEARDKLLASLEKDERAAVDGAPGADVAARAIDDAAGKDATPDEAFAAATAARGEEPAEKRFRETLGRARARATVGDLAGAVTVLEEAAGQAAGGNPVQSAQRRQTADLALARAQYALALSVAEPDRTLQLGRALGKLDGLVNDLGSGCAGPSAAYLRAQAKVFQAKASGGARTPADRDRVVKDVTRELETTLARIAPGSAFEGGTIDVSELPAQFEDTWSMPIAFSDSFMEVKTFTIPFFGPISFPWPVLQRIVLTDERGAEARAITVSGMYGPHLWLAEGQALVASDYGRLSGYPMVVLDRTGQVIRGFPDLSPTSTRTSGGVAMVPAGDAFVVLSKRGEDKARSYWLQDLKGAAPRRLAGPFEGSADIWPDHDPIVFSHDGNQVAWVDFSGSVKIASTPAFLGGGGAGSAVWSLTQGEKARSPAVVWVKLGTSPRLVICPDAEDKNSRDFNRLVAVDGTSPPAPSQRFASDFQPGVVLAHRGSPQVTVIDSAGKRFVTLTIGAGGFTGSMDPQPLPGGPYGTRPGRGQGDVVYLTGGEGGAGLSRWDMGAGTPPARIPIPVETGPTKMRAIVGPVSY